MKNKIDKITFDLVMAVAAKTKKINQVNGIIYINLLGNTTFARNADDIDVAIKEAVECFIHASDHFGKGVKEELCLLNLGKCPHCDNGTLELAIGSEPYTTDHLICNKCDSTYHL